MCFQQRDGQDSQTLNNDTFYRPPVKSAQCNIGTEKYPDSGIFLNYDVDDYSQCYGQIKEDFKALTKDDILNPCIYGQGFRSTYVNAAGEATKDLQYKIYFFDIRYQINLESALPKKVKFKFSENFSPGIYGYALVLTNNLVSVSSDGQRHFDLF